MTTGRFRGKLEVRQDSELVYVGHTVCTGYVIFILPLCQLVRSLENLKNVKLLYVIHCFQIVISNKGVKNILSFNFLQWKKGEPWMFCLILLNVFTILWRNKWHQRKMCKNFSSFCFSFIWKTSMNFFLITYFPSFQKQISFMRIFQQSFFTIKFLEVFLFVCFTYMLNINCFLIVINLHF